jgi:hypothetical protein
LQKHFSEYFRPTEEETKRIWGSAVFVFDTNVLLNLYRMSRETSLQIRGILKTLQERLFLPHQVGVEFFKHLEEVIAEQVNAFERVRQFLRKVPENFRRDFSRHPSIPITEITEALEKCVTKQVVVVTRIQKSYPLNFLHHEDPILPELDALFADSAEGPYTVAEDEALNKKVADRVERNEPPCFVSTGGKASTPPMNNPHRGDGRVWFQIVNHAAATKKPVIFVTGDERPNWWRTATLGNQDHVIGPHFQLIRDIEAASGNGFMMYTQERFLSEAPKWLGVPEQSLAIEEVKQMRESGPREAVDALDEPKASVFETPATFEKGDSGPYRGSTDENPRSADDPKNSPLEDSTDGEKGKPDREAD